MPLPSSGQISLNDFRIELSLSGPISFNDAVVRDLIGKAAGVQASMSEYYGASSGVTVSLLNASSVNVQTAFGADWTADVAKKLVVPQGIVVGSMIIPTGLGGTLEVENSGEIQGIGGSVNGGAGGHAITAASSFTLTNIGAVRAGGGGGGAGGTGGGGQTSSTQTVREPASGANYAQNSNHYYYGRSGICGHPGARWNGVAVMSPLQDSTSFTNGIYTYYRGVYRETPSAYLCAPFDGPAFSFHEIYRTSEQTVTTNTDGGAGGSGGQGQGYGQSSATGNVGSAGGTNAGTGGTGGSGGNWGAIGSTGATGANGNRTNGLAGSAGGAAGKAVHMTSGSVTVINTGTINGAY